MLQAGKDAVQPPQAAQARPQLLRRMDQLLLDRMGMPRPPGSLQTLQFYLSQTWC